MNIKLQCSQKKNHWKLNRNGQTIKLDIAARAINKREREKKLAQDKTGCSSCWGGGGE